MFCVGDRVISLKKMCTFDGDIEAGDIGTVVLKDGGNDIAVAWDRNVGGHSFDGLCKYGHGWWTIRGLIQILEECHDLNPPTDLATLFV